GNTLEALAVQADAHRIDAMLEAAISVEPDIGGGIAEVAAAFFAVDHAAADEPWAAQHRGGFLDLALRKRHANRAGGDRPLLDIHMRLYIDFDSQPRRLGDKQARRANPALAEMKIVADRDAADAKPPDEIVMNEILSGRAGPPFVERHHNPAVEYGPRQTP